MTVSHQNLAFNSTLATLSILKVGERKYTEGPAILAKAMDTVPVVSCTLIFTLPSCVHDRPNHTGAAFLEFHEVSAIPAPTQRPC